MTPLHGSTHNEIVRAALETFWQRGFDGSSYAALMKATGLGKTSLYAAFGDKRTLYLKALEHYVTGEVASAAALLLGCGGAGRPPPSRRRPARQRLRAFLDLAIVPLESSLDGLSDRRGCFLCNAAVEQAPDNPEVAALVTKGMAQLRSALEETVAQALQEREAHRTSGGEATHETGQGDPEEPPQQIAPQPLAPQQLAPKQLDVLTWAKLEGEKARTGRSRESQSPTAAPHEGGSRHCRATSAVSGVVASAETPVMTGGNDPRAAAKPKDIAEHLLSLYVGLRVMAKAGTPAARLKRARDAALRELD